MSLNGLVHFSELDLQFKKFLRPASGRSFGIISYCLLAFSPFLLAGCQTLPVLDTSGPGWKLQQGQAVWRPSRNSLELAGELVLAVHSNGSSVVEFAKPPVRLLSGQATPNAWQIEFSPQKLKHSGVGSAPNRFLWLHLAPALQGGQVKSPLVFQQKSEGGWRLENTQTGEMVEGYTNP